MSYTPNYDAKVKAILDATQPGERVCELTGEKWMMTEEEISWYKKFNVLPSKYHPNTRRYVMSSFWLTFSWWWNKHWKTGERLLTYVHPATGVKVLPDAEWFDEDFISEGRNVDPSRPFIDQLYALQQDVPLLATRHAKKPQNSIAMFSHGDVNSYFVMFCSSKNSFFADQVIDSEDVADSVNVVASRKVYNAIDGHRLYNCQYARSSSDCMNSSFVFDCRNSESCFGAWNRRNKKYLWWNKELSQGEWERRRAEVDLGRRSTVEPLLARFYKTLEGEAVWPENFNEQAVDSTGEYLDHVTNIKGGFLGRDGAHDCYQIQYVYGDSYESAFCASNISSNRCYSCVNVVECSSLRYCNSCQSSQDLEYCIQCFNCEHCFGCVGLNRKKFCILNKQYTEEEYWRVVDEMKCRGMDEDWYGEFIPARMANNSFFQGGAYVYAGATEEVGRKIGTPFFDPEEDGALDRGIKANQEAILSSEIPDCIDDLTEGMINRPYFDAAARRRFAFIKPEIEFYKTQRVPAPNRHFMDRLNDICREESIAEFVETECRACQKGVTIAMNKRYPNRTICCKPCYLQYLEKHG